MLVRKKEELYCKCGRKLKEEMMTYVGEGFTLEDMKGFTCSKCKRTEWPPESYDRIAAELNNRLSRRI